MFNTIVKRHFSFNEFHDHLREKDLREFTEKNEKLKRRSNIMSAAGQGKIRIVHHVSQEKDHIFLFGGSSPAVLWVL